LELVFYAICVLVSGVLWASLVVMAREGADGALRRLAALVVLRGFRARAQSSRTRLHAYNDHRACCGHLDDADIGQQLWSDRRHLRASRVATVLVALILPFIVRVLARPPAKRKHGARYGGDACSRRLFI